MITACCECHKVKNKAGEWIDIDLDPETPGISHGICPDCVRKLYPDMADKILSKSSRGLATPAPRAYALHLRSQRIEINIA